MVRDVCIAMLNHTRYPGKSEREAVAKLVVQTYTFLQDPPINEDKKPWGLWEKKIQNRFKKLPRKKALKDTSIDNEEGKGVRAKKRNVSSWMEVPEGDKSEEDVTGIINNIKNQWKEVKKDHCKITKLMKMTYAKRSQLVLVDVLKIGQIVKMFPPLKNLLYIKSDFARVMGDKDLGATIKKNFTEVWCERILKYAKLERKYNDAFEAMDAALDIGNLTEEECKGRTAIKLASHILKPANKKGGVSNGNREADLHIVLENQSLDEKVKNIVQPVIVLKDGLYSPDLMYIVAEGSILCTITSNKLSDALVALLATYLFRTANNIV